MKVSVNSYNAIMKKYLEDLFGREIFMTNTADDLCSLKPLQVATIRGILFSLN